MKRKARTWRRIRKQLRKPFKGGIAYEWQIGPIVLMCYHNEHDNELGLPPRHTGLKRIRVWHDHHWWGIPKRGPYA